MPIIFNQKLFVNFALCLAFFLACEGNSEKGNGSLLHFTYPLYNTSIYENSAPKTYMENYVKMGIYITDPAWDIKYQIVFGDTSGLFKAEEYIVGDFCFLRIRTRSGNTDRLNREFKDKYLLIIHAREKTFAYETWAKVLVQILDRNDLKPLFSPPSYKVTVEEDTPPKTTIGWVSATDADIGQNAEFYYMLSTRSQLFTIHPTSGIIMSAVRLNATHRGKHQLKALAVDRMRKISEGNGFGNMASLTILVEPSTRKPPVIASVKLVDSAEDLLYATLSVKADGSGAGVDAVDIVDGDPRGHFRTVRSYMGSNDFMIVSDKEINWSNSPRGFNLSLQAKDKNKPPLFSQAVFVQIQPSKYSSAKFEKDSYQVQLNEFAPPGSHVAMVQITPVLQNVKYMLKLNSDSINFKINPQTGVITTARRIDFHKQSHFEFEVTATYRHLSTTVIVDVIDCNNHAPSFTRSSYLSNFDENLPPGSSVLSVKATDSDSGENGFVTYNIANQKTVPFVIDPFTGVISTTKLMDYELMQRLYYLRIWASDSGSPFRHQTEVHVSLFLNNLNDNVPVFEKINCNGSIPWDLPIGHSVFTVSAIDRDELNPIKYEIKSGNEEQFFELNPVSGVISLRAHFKDFHYQSLLPISYALKISATDGNNSASPACINITVVKQETPLSFQCEETGVLKELANTIMQFAVSPSPDHQDEDSSLNTYLINRHAPQFDDTFPRSIDIPETTPVNSTIAQLTAIDSDAGFNGKMVYVISSGNEESCFDIDTEVGLLLVLSPLDHERTSFYVLNITVYDLGSPQKSTWKLLAVNVLDVNDNAPTFLQSTYLIPIPEDIRMGTTVAVLTANDADTNDNSRVKYSFLTHSDKFAINSVTGEVVVTATLDRELEPQYILKVEARDQPQKGHQLFAIADLVISLEDVNDNAPYCIPALNKMNVPEDLPLGTTLLFLEAFDPDITSEGELKYSLITDHENTFHLNELTGSLTLEKELDYEKIEFYNISVKISDAGKLSSLCYIEVNVLDINENLHPPSFDSFVYEGSVKENSQEGTPVMRVVAQDGDRGKDGQIQYFIREGSGMALFNIENDTGLIFTMGPLDRELCSHYWLTVLAVDKGSVPLSSVVEIYIEISDINDNPPQMSRTVFYSSVLENSPANTSILQVEAFDPDTDSQGKLTFLIINGNHQGMFAINPFTGLIYTTSQQLDREHKAEHILEVSVSDNGDPVLQSSSRVVIQVLDVNDNPPSFSQKLFMVQLPEKAASETPLPVYRVIAADRDEGLNCQITYSLEENSEGLFSIHPVTGIVFSQKAFSAQEYNILTVKATDGGTPQLSSSVRLHIDWIPKPFPSSEPLAFDEPHFNFTVMETDPVNHMVGVISVDAGLSQIWFNITGGDDAMNFDIEKSTGSIVIARTLDAKERSNYNLTIEVTDGSSIIKTQVSAYIHVIDINQHPPRFLEYHYEARIPEDTPPGTEFLGVSAADQDHGKALIYTLHSSLDPRSLKFFQIDPSRGMLVTVSNLDAQSMPLHTLTVMVRDQDVPIKRDFARIVIHIEGCNSHPPQFTSLHYKAEILNVASIGTEVVQVRAVDLDQGVNAEVHYCFEAGNSGGFFTINKLSGIITVSQKLDQSKQERFALTVKAEDQGFPQLKDSTTVNIYIKASDTTPPQFTEEEYVVEISESAVIGSPVILVSAISSSFVTYEIKAGDKEGFFSINYQSGLISTQKSLDFEQTSSYQLKIRATNMAGSFMDVPVFVYLIDQNDNLPIFDKPSFIGWIDENIPFGSIVVDENNVPLVINATDADQDSNALLIYEILEMEAMTFFKIDQTMGTLTTCADIDYEHNTVFHFGVHVHDSGNPILFASKPVQVTIYIRNINDCPPVFIKSFYDLSVILPIHDGMELLKVNAKDADSEVIYSIAEGNLTNTFFIHKTTGAISVVNHTNVGNYHEFTIRAGDGLYVAGTLVRLHFTEPQDSILKFDQDVYLATVKENSTESQIIIVLGVIGNQLNEPLFYSILNGTEWFRMIPSSGVLQTKNVKFDREIQDVYEIAVEVKDVRNPPGVSQAIVRIIVDDINDNPPQFENLPYYIAIPAGTEPGDIIFTVSATDQDLGNNGVIFYSFVEEYQHFWIDTYSGDISLKQPLDLKTLNKYTLSIIARDGGEPPLYAEEEITIMVKNKSSPLFPSLFYTAKVPESNPPYTPILHLQARSPEGLRLIYNIVEKDALRLFHIDFKTGMLMATSQLDYESDTKHTFTVRATETATGSYSEAIVEVHVEDVNDNFPLFSQTVYTVSISEDVPAQTPVIQLLVTDQDSGWNKLVSYQILEDRSESSQFFSIDGSTGEISTTQGLDYEMNREFHIKVRATDHGLPPLSNEVLVIVSVLDINDNPPQFSQLQYQANVSKMVSCGQVVVKVQAFDPDSRDTPRLEYMILSGNEKRHFTMDSTSGIISTLNHCKKNLESFYGLRVSASDGVFKATVPVYINTTNVNKYSPAFQRDVYEVVLAENTKVGTEVIELSAIDPDDGAYGTINYIIINKLGQEKFLIDDKGRIETLQKLDRENSTERVVDIKIMAKDGGGKVAFCTVKIILTDENDNRPQFKASEYLLSIRSDMRKGSPVIQVLAYDADEGVNADVIYSVDRVITEDVIEINTATGVIVVKESLKGLENQTLKFGVKAEDAKPPNWHSVVPVKLQVVPREVSLPRFSEPLYTFSAYEDLPEGSEIGLVRAIGKEPIIYSLVEGTSAESNEEEIFTLDKQTGILTVQKPMDYEKMKWYQVDVLARSSYKNTELFSLVTINIHVKDVNDNKPIFEADPYRAFVMENMPAGTPVIQITANDQDTGSDGQVTYSLGSGLSYIRDFFTIDSENGWIMTLKELDCEVQNSYKFFVVASDHGKKIQFSSQTLVEVTVTDENDNAPEFSKQIYKGSVVENAEPGQMITILNSIDRDLSEENRQVVCYITEGDVMGQFGITEVDGKWKVFSKKLLDREETEKYLLKVMVSDGKFQAATEVEILVLDVNDNSPECKQVIVDLFSEIASQGFSVLKVLATDVDAGSNGQITYSLHGVGAEDFRLDSYTGELTTSTLLDRELNSKYHLVAKATDGGGRFCQMEITVHIDDINDNAPRFYPSHYAVAIYDNTSIKTPIAVVFAKDPDESLNSEVRYHLAESANGHFSVNEVTGVILLEKPLKESPSVLELTVLAEDRGVPQSLSSFTTVTVSVVDLKEYLPVFLSTEYLIEVKENVAVGTEVLNLSTLTRSTVANTEIRYEITSGNYLGKFRLHSSTGILYINGTLDFEVAHEYYLTIEGIRKTSTSFSDVTMILINVTDINDHVPEFGQDLYIANISEDAAIGEIVLANDKDGLMNNQITYSIVEGNPLSHFMIDPKAGEIYTAKHLDREEVTSYSLKIQAMDNGETALSSDTIVLIHVSDVNDNPPRFFQLNYSVAVQENSPIGTSVLELIVSDRDSPENGPPYNFQIVEGNEGKAFQINQAGVLVTSSTLNRRTKEQYLLQVQVVDSGRPPLSSSAFISIYVIQQSQYPPSALPLEIFITTNERTFRGGVLGKIHATDRDPHDTLLYSFVSVVPEKKQFSVGLSDGKIIATEGLQHGHYSLNVSVSDGTFSTITRVQVHVWSFSQDALDKAVTLHFRHLNPEEFISDHWRNLQRFLGNILETKRQNVHMASLQPSEASNGVDLLLAVGEPQYSLYKPSFIATRISQSTEEMDQRVGLRVKKVTYVPCHEVNCIIQRTCKETFQLDPGTVFTYSSARFSVLTPRHSLEQICSCNGEKILLFKIIISPTLFSGHSYIWYHHQGKRDWQMHFHLQTHQLHAILLTTNGSNSAVLQVGFILPHLGYRCRSGFSANLSSHRFVSDSTWHSVFLEVKSHSIHLLVDDMGNASLHLPESCSISHSTRDLLIGGLVQHHQPQRITGGFKGCLNMITMDGRNLVVLPKEKRSRGVVEESSIRQCCPHSGACSSNPCLNDGLCSEVQNGGHVCTCTTQFSGDHCEVADGFCEGNPCLHGGTCELSEKGGYICQYSLNKCLQNPCKNSGRCVNSEGFLRCICTDHFQGPFCSQTIGITTINPSSEIWKPEVIAKISAGVLGIVILVIAIITIYKCYCHKVKAHKPVAKEDPDLLSKNEFSKSVGVGTQGLPPIELNILNNGHHNHFSALDPAKPSVVPEFTTFHSSNVQKQRGAIVCSVAPNLPAAAPLSNTENDSTLKSSWTGEKMGLFYLCFSFPLSSVSLGLSKKKEKHKYMGYYHIKCQLKWWCTK
uniref:FAT atypical cadherin 2 n=1 Tax=Pseudonaja textilis TaxID=8673 RepID=A0A670Z7Q3_PSETE